MITRWFLSWAAAELRQLQSNPRQHTDEIDRDISLTSDSKILRRHRKWLQPKSLGAAVFRSIRQAFGRGPNALPPHSVVTWAQKVLASLELRVLPKVDRFRCSRFQTSVLLLRS